MNADEGRREKKMMDALDYISDCRNYKERTPRFSYHLPDVEPDEPGEPIDEDYEEEV